MATHALTTNVVQFPTSARRPTITQSPEMIVATAIFKVLPIEIKDAIRRKIDTLALTTANPNATEALAILERIA